MFALTRLAFAVSLIIMYFLTTLSSKCEEIALITVDCLYAYFIFLPLCVMVLENVLGIASFLIYLLLLLIFAFIVEAGILGSEQDYELQEIFYIDGKWFIRK